MIEAEVMLHKRHRRCIISLSDMRSERNAWLCWSLVLLALNVFQYSTGC